jgi:hypothetical protein
MAGAVGVAPSTTTLTLPDGSTIALADWIDDKLFGSCQFVNGQTSPLEVYSSGRSQPIPGGQRVQTRVDTNIPRNGDSGLPKDWEMLVYGWGIKVSRVMRGPQSNPVAVANPNDKSPTLKDDFDTNTNGTIPPPASMAPGAWSDPPNLRTLFGLDRVVAFQYEYNAKFYSQGVIQDYPQGHGYSVFSTNTAFEVANNGIPSPRDRVALVLPVHERENLGYKGVFQPEAPVYIIQAASDGKNALNYADVKLYKYGLIKRTVV